MSRRPPDSKRRAKTPPAPRLVRPHAPVRPIRTKTPPQRSR